MIYEFDDCLLDTHRYTLHRAGQAIALRPKAFQLLLFFLDHHERVVTKQEMSAQVWPKQYISNATLESTVREVRRAIGDSGRAQQMIETRYRQGYRFVGEVRHASAVPTENDPSAPDPSTPLPSSVAERKVVTLLSCGLARGEGIVDLDTLHSQLLALYGQLESVAATYGGTLQTVGEEQTLLVFGAPQAQEDHAERGVLAGLSLLHGLAADNASSPLIKARLAVHTSEVAVGGLRSSSMAEVAVGSGVGVVHAIQSSVSPGELVCSWATAQRLQGVVELEPLEALTVDGQPQMRYRVIGLQVSSNRLSPRAMQSRFVGRGHELSILGGLLDRVRQGSGQVVGVVGEPGIGKTRLVAEFRRRLTGRQVRYWQSHCPSYGVNSAFLPLITLLRGLWGLRAGMAPASMRAAIEAGLSALDTSLSKRLPYMLRLLEVPGEVEQLDTVSAQAIRSRTIDTVVQLILQHSARQPLIVEIENLHWLDPSSEEVLSALAERLPPYPVLLLLTYRPGYRAPWGDKSYATQVAVSALSPQDSRHLVRWQLGGQSVSDTIIDTLVERGSGNPLFLEELTHAVGRQDTGLRVASVPETIQTVVLSRIDRLSPAVKQLLQVASVVGNEVSAALLQAVTEASESALSDQLRQVQAEELMFASRRHGETMYHFKHKLVQEVVYNSLLQPGRRQYHGQIAQCLANASPDALPEQIAHHYTEAGHNPEAIAYWQRAAQRALERTALSEAIGHLRNGLALIPDLPESPERVQTELGLLMLLGPALMATEGYASEDVAQTYHQAQELCDQLGDVPELFAMRFGLWVYGLVGGDYRMAQAQAEVLLRFAEKHDDPEWLLAASFALGSTCMFLGELPQGRTYLERSIALYDINQHRNHAHLFGFDLGVAAQSLLSILLWLQGYPSQALTRIQETIVMAEGMGHPYSLCYGQHNAVAISLLHRDVPTGQSQAETLHTLATDQDFPEWALAASCVQGWLLGMQGDAQAGIDQMQEGIAGFRKIGTRAPLPYFLAMLAEAHGCSGNPEAGLRVLSEALALIEGMGGHWMEAELYRLQGELRQQAAGGMRNAAWTPEACFKQALEVARRQQAKSWELRAAISLARLWQSQGKTTEARQLLAPVYAWFTEGFDTGDLQDAQALLTQ